VKSWQGLTEDQIQFDRLPGLSNLIWKVTALNAEIEPKALIYRKFGETTGVLNRDRENFIFSSLAKLGLGPINYSESTKYRIEEFHENEPVVRADIREARFRRTLAADLSKFHSAPISGSYINQDPFMLKVLRDGLFDKDFDKKLLNTTFDEGEQVMLEEIKSTVYSKEERALLISLLPTAPSSLVFSHNDLHSGNILRLKGKSSFLLIDCEYNDYNYRGFDIANLFNEAMLDYSYPAHPFYAIREEQSPPVDELEDFAKYYMFYKTFPEKCDDAIFTEKALLDSSLLDEYVRENGKTSGFLKEVSQLLYEVEVCKMLSHYYWVIWSVIFSKKAEIQFDYVSYGLDRLRLYKKAKKEFFERTFVSVRSDN